MSDDTSRAKRKYLKPEEFGAYRGKQIEGVEAYFISNHGGMGDQVTRLPAMDWIMKTTPWLIAKTWWPDYFAEFAKRSLLGRGYDERIHIGSFTELDQFRKILTKPVPGYSFHPYLHTNLRTHLVNYAFHTWADVDPSIAMCEYLAAKLTDVDVSRLELPKSYAVVATAFTAPSRQIAPDTVSGICDYLSSCGITPVFLGREESKSGPQSNLYGMTNPNVDFSKGLDLREQTTLEETAKILQGAKVVIGTDNGLSHLAAATGDVPIVSGYTIVPAVLRMPIRRGQLGYNVWPIEAGCKCKQTDMGFVLKHQFNFCFQKTYECVQELTAEVYIEAIEDALKHMEVQSDNGQGDSDGAGQTTPPHKNSNLQSVRSASQD